MRNDTGQAIDLAGREEMQNHGGAQRHGDSLRYRCELVLSGPKAQSKDAAPLR